MNQWIRKQRTDEPTMQRIQWCDRKTFVNTIFIPSHLFHALWLVKKWHDAHCIMSLWSQQWASHWRPSRSLGHLNSNSSSSEFHEVFRPFDGMAVSWRSLRHVLMLLHFLHFLHLGQIWWGCIKVDRRLEWRLWPRVSHFYFPKPRRETRRPSLRLRDQKPENGETKRAG